MENQQKSGESPVEPVTTVLPLPPVLPVPKRTHIKLLLVIAAVGVLSLGYLLGRSSVQRQLSNTAAQNQTVQTTGAEDKALSPTTVVPQDPMASWLTYSNIPSGYQVKYPADWKIEDQATGMSDERVANSTYIEIFKPQSDPTKSVGNIGFGESAVLPPSQAALLTQEKTINGQTFKCQGEEGPDSKLWCWVKIPGREQYLNVNIFTNTDNEANETFQQIFSTLTFNKPTVSKFTINEISQACIAIHDSAKYWDPKYQECNGNGEDETQLKSFCTKYGGTLVPDGANCRHAQAEGTPCGPGEIAPYCSFAN